MAAKRDLNVTISGDSRSLNRALADVNKGTAKVGRSLDGLKRAAKLTGVALGAGLAVEVKRAFGEFREAEKAAAQTAAVLKSTGGAAKVTAKDVETLANAISLKAGIDDEAIQSAENLLLTFTAVRNEAGKGNDIFDQATTTIVDMAAAMAAASDGEINLKTATIQVGKALQDPIKGATALAKVGVALSESDKERIKTLVASGRAMDAQKIVLRELKKEFGGSAAAQADATDKAKVALENLEEAFGKTFGPGVSKALTGVAKFVTEMQTGAGAGGKFANGVRKAVAPLRSFGKALIDNRRTLATVALAIAPLVAGFVAFSVISKVILLFKGLKLAIIGVNVAMVANPIGLVVAALVGLGVALVVAYKKSQTFRRIVDGAFSAVKKVAESVFPAISGAIRAAAKVIRGYVSIYKSAALGIAKGVVSAFDFLKRLPGKIGQGLSAGRKKITGWIGNFGSAALKIGKEIVSAIIRGLASLPDKLKKKITGAIGDAAKGIGGVLDKVNPFGDIGDKIGDAMPAPGFFGQPGTGPLSGKTAGLAPVAMQGLSAVQTMFGGVNLTSGRRSPEQNRAAGGASNSDHLWGGAIDLVPAEGWTQRAVARFDRIAAWARRAPMVRWIGWRGVPGHGPGNHLHLGFKRAGKKVGDFMGRAASGGMAHLARLVRSVGLKGRIAETMAAVGMGESGGIRGRVGDGGDSIGEWQINMPAHPQWSKGFLSNSANNAKAMLSVLRSQGLGAWTIYNTGAYKQHLAAAKRALAGGGGGGSAPGKKDAGLGRLPSVDRGLVTGAGALLNKATVEGEQAESLGSRMGRLQRRFGLKSSEGGESVTENEAAALRYVQWSKIQAMKRRATAIRRAIAKLNKLLKSLTKRHRAAKGQRRRDLLSEIKKREAQRAELKGDLKQLGEEIADADLDLAEIEADAVDAPDGGEAPEFASPIDRIGSDLQDIDLQERAGVLTEAQARSGREWIIREALRGAYGALSQQDTWQLMGDLRDITAQSVEATNALKEEIKGLKDSIDQSNAIASSTLGIGLREAQRALADMISGQLGARVGNRGLSPAGGGVAVRY